MSNKFAKRSLEIIGESLKETGKEYTSSIWSLINDAKEIRSSIVKSGQDAAETFSRIKSTDMTKKISDWFYTKEQEFDIAGASSDNDFDAGFKINDSEDEESSEQTSSSINIDSMSDKQTGAMYKIGRRQTEQSVINTSEIISSLNSRSSELLASMNNVNKSLIGISDRLDKLIEISTIESTNTEKRYGDKDNGLLDDGKLTLSGIWKSTSNDVNNNYVVSMVKSVVDMMKGGQLTPESLFDSFIKPEIFDKKINALGGKSIDDIGKSFNEAIDSAAQIAMSEIISSDPFKKLFGDITTMSSDQDYSRFTISTYDTKKANFDGMTRLSIIKVIPEMLSKINESISGVGYHVDSKGNLVKSVVKNTFGEATHSLFSSSGLSTSATNKILENSQKVINPEISSDDINKAAKALTTVIAIDMHTRGQRVFTVKDFSKDTLPYIEMATEILSSSLGNSREYWAKVCQVIIHQMSSNKFDAISFVKNINSSLDNMIRRATEYASSGKSNAMYAGRITQKMAFEEFKKVEGDNRSSVSYNNDDSDHSSVSTIASTIIDGNISNNRNSKNDQYSSHDYLRGIFGILNRGINVKNTNKKNSTRGYDSFNLKDANIQQSSRDNIAGEVFANMFMGGESTNDDDLLGNAVKNAVDATKEALMGSSDNGGSINVNGSGQGLLGNMFSILGASSIQSLTRRFVSGDLRRDVTRAFNEVQYDPMTGELVQGGARKAFQNVKSSFNTAVGKVRNTGQIIGSEISDRMSDGTKNTLNRVGNIVLGDSTGRDLNGDIVRNQNGLIHTARDRAVGFVGNTADRVSAGANRFTNMFTSRIQYLQDSNNIRNLNRMFNSGSADYSDDDINIARQIMNSASRMSSRRWNNGSSQQDMMANIESISDLNLRNQVSNASTILTNRNVAATQQGGISEFMVEHDIKGKANSIVSVVQKGFAAVGKTLGKIAETLTNIAKDGLRNIYYGLSSMKEGLFGGKKRDIDGNVIYDENGKAEREKGLVRNLIEVPGTVASSIKDKITNKNDKNNDEESDNSSFLNVIGDVLHNVHEMFNNVGDVIKEKFSDIADGVKEKFSGVLDHIKNLGSKIFSREEETIYDPETGEETTRKKGLIPRAGDAFRKTSFGSGFMSGFDRAREAKKEAAEKAEREGSFINRTAGSILDVLTGKEQGGSLLNQILDMMDGIRSDINTNHEEDMMAATEDESIDNSSTEETSTVETGQIGDASITEIPDTDQSSSSSTRIESSSSITDNSNTSVNAGDTVENSSGETSSRIASSSENSGGGIKSLFKNMLGGLGKVMGGFTQALLGIGQLVASIVMGMEGLNVIKDLISNILVDGLAPLNEVFESIADLIKPIAETLTTMVETIVNTVVTIAESLIDAIQPIMEAIQPILETVTDILKPILELIGDVIIGALMTPLLIIVKALQPVIEEIGYVLKITSGILSVGMGSVITLLGSLLTGIGFIVKFLTHDSSLVDQGKSMLKTGKDLMSSGVEQIKEGVVGTADLMTRLLPGGESPVKSDNDEKENKPTIDTSEVNLTHASEGTVYGSGDTNYNTTYAYNNTFGSGNSSSIVNQHSYGSYMNMSERGCGPVALADAYSRRTGVQMNPLMLASQMAGNGSYNPNRGTSVGSFIRTGNALGMGMQIGGVTTTSLKRATPTNPITLLGSGTEYGTHRGNDHYVNVIGTDRGGGAYVANPLTGRVSRTSAASLAMHSKLGLYGSGDNDDFYKFDEETTEALGNLKELTNKLTTMFTGDAKSDVESKIEDGDEENKANQIKRRLGDDFEEYEKKAFDMFKKDHPKRDGESNEEYDSRIEKSWDKSANYNKYIIKVGGEEAYNKSKHVLDGALSASDKINSDVDKFADSMSSLNIDMSSGSNSSGSYGENAESETGAIMAPYKPIRYTKTAIDSETSDKSPVHDFFSATSGSRAYTKNGGWYQRGKAPVSTEGAGTTGDRNGGIDISFADPEKGGELHAITGGTAVYVTRSGKHGKVDPNGGLGNAVKWRDDSGMYHWYLHMSDIDNSVQENATIKPGQVLGHVGNTGYTESEDDKHLHYIVTSAGPKGNTGDDGFINPLTYWKFVEKATGGKEGKINLTTTLSKGSAWSVHKNKSGVPKFIKLAQESGMTPAQIATIMSTGIWEDGGEKLWGSKSLVNKTYDYNGQVATGIMNWVDQSVNYGNTVPEQLNYIRKTYFDASSKDSRATARRNGFEQQDLSAFMSATGRSGWNLGFGEKYGPYMESDLLEGSDHFFRVALVPECIHTTAGVGKYVGTAADIYNWMIDQGLASGGSTTSSDKSDNEISGQFISTVRNKSSSGNSGDILEAAAQVWEAYTNKVPAGTYAHGNKGPVTTRSGVRLDHLHPDCSGMISATMNYMGYTFDPSKSTAGTCDKYRWCTYDIVGKTSNNGFILGPDGKPSDDWIFKNFDPNDMQEGDIITTQEHVGLYVQPGSDRQNALGFDAGNGERTRVVGPGQAKRLLDGDPNWRDSLQWTMGPAYPGLRTTLRYVGDKSKKSDNNAGNIEGGFNNSALYNGTSVDNLKTSSKTSYEINSSTNEKKRETTNTTTATGNKVEEKAKKKKGSGDTPSIEPWESSLISDNMFDNSSNIAIPELDESRLVDEYPDMDIPSSPGVIIQKYEIKSDDSNRVELLNRLNKMTFNVRAERVEQLLEEIILKMDNVKQTRTNYPEKNNTPTSLFDTEAIPAQVALLARG